MKKVKVKGIEINEVRTRYDYSKEPALPYQEYIFTAWVKVGFETKVFKFVTLPKYKCAFLDTGYVNYDTAPIDDEVRRQILIKAYGLLHKIIAEYEMADCLREIQEEIEKEKREKEEQERKRKIALGEQISIEKYILNKN